MSDELKADLRELKADVKELVKLGAIHNTLLQTHEARSLALQEEQKLQAASVVKIEKQTDWQGKVLAAAGVLFMGLLAQALLRLVF